MKVLAVVGGAGACGLVAALAAKEAGVLDLERDASPSGSGSFNEETGERHDLRDHR